MSAFDGIDRSVSPESFSGMVDRACRPLTVELFREWMRQIAMQGQRRHPDLLPPGLFEIVRDHGWGKEALAWFDARYREQFGGK